MSDVLPAMQPPSQTCKKCSHSIFEGHAYELGDDRWHIDCFKCFKCDTLLGCNSNFLVLGNGSLVCSNCSYSCKQCNKKIDDLAILTGDQAYCSNCFKCRVCKLKIEDLRYARTSKGLFCMSCHEELIAKKKKHDLKRKQLALLLLLLRPSPSEEVDIPLFSSSSASPSLLAASVPSYAHKHDVYLHRNPSLTSVLNKQLPPHPGSRGSGTSPSLTDSLAPTAPSTVSSIVTVESESTHSVSDATPQAPSMVSRPSYTSTTSDLTQKLVMTAESKLLTLALPKTPSTPNVNTSYDIEEVNDSDDELNLRRVRERLERRFLRTNEEPDGAILDLIDSFSTPNTPSTIYNKASASESANQETLEQAQAKTPVVRQDSGKSRSRPSDLASPNKNILLLSPNQYHDNDFHNTPNMHLASNSLATEDIRRPRSSLPSPMAKANRQARVVETGNTTPDLGRESKSPERKFNEYTTPKKSSSSRLPTPVTSPPPRMALPEVPSTPRQNDSDAQRKYERAPEAGEPRGLGLEGIDMQKVRTIKMPTPAITNLENTFPEDAEYDVQQTPPSRKASVRSKMLIRHKRSTSNGLGSFSSKLGFFKPRDEINSQKGHSRHMLDGSVAGQAFTTPPLPFTSPMELITRREAHARSTSDTNFITGLESEVSKSEFEMRSLKFEIYQLDTRRQALLAENMKLNSDKGKLLDTLNTIQKQVVSFNQMKDALSREVQELKVQKNELKEENEGVRESIQRSRDELREVTEQKEQHHQQLAPVIETPSDMYESGVSESISEEGAEAQKATRLKFWRRPKVTITNANAPQSQNSGSHLQPLNGGLPHSTSSYKLGQGYSSNMVQNPNQNSTNEDYGNRKALNSFMTKSRSTTILDSFVNGQNGANGSGHPDVPLLTSTLQRRATFENEKVPLIVTKCIEEVENRGLDMEGIYRLSGGNSAISAIEGAFAGISPNGVQDKKQLAKLNDVLSGDINAVTSALKRYLRKLPDPLIPFALYESFILIGQSKSDNDELCNDFKTRVINRLPPANKHAMYMICKHLDKVNLYSNVNRMNFKNLSVVFAPTIARDATGEREMIDMGPRNEATELLFSNFDILFSEYTENA